MKGDFSRSTFHREKHYSSVLMQQGRVQLDADWNEQQAITRHRIETEARDVIGSCGAPMDNAGFCIAVENGKTLLIRKGRYYVDGILCENDTDKLPYDDQPDFPTAPNWLGLLEEANTSLGLVYLDVWQRHITALDDPLIREKALGGPDSTTRTKTIWQVKVMPVENADQVTCDSLFEEWNQLLPISTGKLNAHTQTPSDQNSPCLLPPSAGYQRLENQLYRVEVHEGGPLEEATFKWSRDNGTVVTTIEKISGKEITVHDIGPDDVLGFAVGQWVEITDDSAELSRQPGQLIIIKDVNPATRVIELESAPPAVNPDELRKLHYKLRRWDQSGPTATEQGVRMTPGWIGLEGGIEVQFENGEYKTGDYWLIPARTETGEIEWPPHEVPNTDPISQPPLGIRHHYCPLALVTRERTIRSVRDVIEEERASPRYNSWTFNLTTGLRMPDDTLVTAAVVKDILDKYGTSLTGYRSSTIVRDYIIRVRLSEPDQNFPEKLEEIPIFEEVVVRVEDCRRIFPPLTKIAPNKWATIEEINWENDQPMSLEKFNSGLMVRFSESMDPNTASPETFIVTLELPEYDPVSEFPGHRPFIVQGAVKAENSKKWRFEPQPQIENETLKNWIGNEGQLFHGDRIRCRVVLEGNAILDAERSRPLDGDAFGEVVTENDVSFTKLILPSGDGIKGGDFESWFYLVER